MHTSLRRFKQRADYYCFFDSYCYFYGYRYSDSGTKLPASN